MKHVSPALLLWLTFVLPLHADLQLDLQAIADGLVEQGSPAALLYVEDPALGTNALASGVRDTNTLTAAQPTDRFRIASISKTFTAAATLLLCEQGVLNLSNKVAELLPEPEYAVPSNSVITVSNLLTHTSGLPDHNNDTNYFDTRAVNDPTTNFSPGEVFEVVRSLPSHFAPGAQYRYCDTGFYILSLIIEKRNTNGWSYAEFIRHRFLEPLGMTNTFVPDSTNGYLRFIPGTHVRGYFGEGDGGAADFTDIGQSWDIGCGGMVSCTKDLATWVRAIYGGSILSPDSLTLMTTPTVQSRQADARYGMGTAISPVLGSWHSGATMGYLSWASYDPVRRTACAQAVTLLDEERPLGRPGMLALYESKWALGYDDIEDLRYSNTIAQVTAYTTNAMAQAGVPSMSIALVDSNRIVWARGFGLADREAGVEAHSDTMYGICSISKTFAGAAILKLQEDALVGLDDPVTNHVPSFAILPRAGMTNAITVRQLLNHVSGIPGTYYNHAVTVTPQTNYHTFVLETLARDYPNFAPVEDIVKARTGQDYATFVSSNLFRPMGMLSSKYFGAEPVARSYVGGVRYPNEIVNAAAGGGVYSSAQDMGQYIQTLLAWGMSPKELVVLESNSVAALWRDETTNVPIRFLEQGFKPGLGWDCIADPEFAYAGLTHNKNGGAETFGSFLEVIPERGLGVIVLNNYSGAGVATPVAKEALRWALKDKFALDWPTNRYVPAPSPITNLPIAELDAVTGCYAIAEGYDIIRRDGTNLTWIRRPNSATPTTNGPWVGRENGWFSHPDTQDTELSFTNVGGRDVMYMRAVTGTHGTYFETGAYGEKFTPVALSAAWSNRLNKLYLMCDVGRETFYWYPAYDISLRLSPCEGAIFLRAKIVSSSVLVPDSDSVAFPRGIASAEATSLQAFTTNGIEYLFYDGFTYQPVDSYPLLYPGSVTNLSLAPGETKWFAVPGWLGDPQGVTITNASSPLALSLRAPDGTWLATGTNAVQWVCGSNATYYLAVSATNAATGDLRAYSLTNTIAQATKRIEGLMTSNDVVGLSVALVDGQVIAWARGFGFADRENGIPVTTNTVFRIGSVSKVFTATAAMQYRDQGKLGLDDSVTNYLPGLRLLDRGGFPGTDAITVRDLLDHHSGLPGDLLNSSMTTEPVDGRYAWLTNYLAGTYPVYPPRLVNSYCNSGFILMEGVVEAADGSGTPFTDMVNSNLFEPLGMNASSILKDKPDITNHLAKPYVNGQVMPEEFINIHGTGGMYSRPVDLANYIRMVLAGGIAPNGTRILEANSVAEMLAPQATNAPFEPFVWETVGLGWDTVRSPELSYAGDLAWKNGMTTVYRANMAVLPNCDLGFAITISSPAAFAGGPLYFVLQQAVSDKYGIPAPTNTVYFPAATQAVSQAELDALAGIYAAEDGYHRLESQPGSLTLVLNAHSDEPPPNGSRGVITNMLLRTDGWFSVGVPPSFSIVITNIVGRTALAYRQASGAISETSLLGERFNPEPLSAAWSNRLAKTWFVLDESPVSYFVVMGFSPRLAFTNRDDLLLVQSEYAGGSHVLSPTNDNVAFVCGLVNAEDSAVQVFTSNTFEYLRFAGYTWQPADSFPVLYPGSMTNLSIAAGETRWFAVPGWTGDPQGLTITNASAPLLLNLYTPEGSLLGRGTNALPWICPTDGTYYVSVGATGAATGSLRVYSLTNTIAYATQWIGEQMTNSGVVGLSVALVDGQEIAWAQGFGYADRENGIPVTTNTVFRIGSISKVFTTTAAMQYRDRGKLGLDDSVTNYLPGLRLLERGGFPGTEAVAVRDLLDHHSGLPGNLFNAWFTTEPRGDRYAWLTNYLAGTYPIYPPRQAYSYCNTAFVLTEGVIEAADGSGTPFTSLVNSNVFNPLGMNASSYLKDKPDIIDNLAKPYSGGRLMPEEHVNAHGTGSMYSRPIDLANYIRMVLAGGIAPNGTRILEADSVAEMLTPQATEAPLSPFIWVQVGLGWDSVRWPALSYAGNVAWKNGQTFAYSANLSVLPERNIGFVIVVNALADFAVTTPDLILQHAVNDKHGMPIPTITNHFPAATQAVSQVELDALAGIYAAAEGYQRVVANPGSLTLFGGDVRSNMLLRTDGWFSAGDTPTYSLLFTNIAGRTVLVQRGARAGYATTNVFGERIDPAPLSAAWSNRLEKLWFALDDSPVSYYPYLGATPLLTFATNDGVLLVASHYIGGSCVLSPTNDDTAFICGLESEVDSAVQVFTSNTFEYLRFAGYTWQPTESFPVLYPGSTTNLSLGAGETRWFAMPGWTGDPQGLTITNASSPLLLNLYTPEGSLLVRGTNTLPWICPTSGTYYFSVGSMSAATGNMRAYSLTNTIAVTRTAVTGYMDRFDIPGVSVGLVDGDQIAWIEHFGYADRETSKPVDSNTVFMIGSLSKAITATLALELFDEGRLGLDASVTNYLLGFSLLPRFAGFPTNITSRNMLDHHSGLPGDIWNGGTSPLDRYWPGYTDWLIAYFAEDYALYAPDRIASYCNSGFNVVAEILEQLEGTNFPAIGQARLFEPLDMAYSSFAPDRATVLDNLATGYQGGEPLPPAALNMPATGGAFSRAEDITHFMMMLMNDGYYEGEAILTTNALAQMGRTAKAVLDVDNYLQPGLGLDTADDPALSYGGRTRAKNGSTGFFESFMELLPDQGLGCIALMNTSPEATYGIVRAALKAAMSEKAGLVAPPIPPMDFTPTNRPQADLLPMEGLYVTRTGPEQFVAETNGTLTCISIGLTNNVVSTGYQALVNGRYSVPGHTNLQCAFTNVAGEYLVMRYGDDGGVASELIYDRNMRTIWGSRFVPPGVPAAWSNRVGVTWLACNLFADDFSVLLQEPATYTLHLTNGILRYVWRDGVGVLEPVNDDTAYVAGLITRADGAARILHTNGIDLLQINGYRCMRVQDVPALTLGVPVSGTNLFHEGNWYSADLPVGTYTLTCSDTNITMVFCADLSAAPVVAAGSHTFVMTSPGTVYIALVTMSSIVPYELDAGRATLLIDEAQVTPSGMVLKWISQPGTNYAVEISTNLAGNPAFGPYSNNIPSTDEITTTWTAAPPTHAAAYYRVVEEEP